MPHMAKQALWWARLIRALLQAVANSWCTGTACSATQGRLGLPRRPHCREAAKVVGRHGVIAGGKAACQHAHDLP